MSFLIEMGKDPVGEAFITPPDGRGVCWLMGQFYDGTQVKLIRFKQPLESPEKGSPMDRMYELEDDHLQNAKWIKSIMEFIKGAHMADLGISAVAANISKWEAFIASRDELLTTDSPYMVTNYEMLQRDRGWIGEGE